MRAAASQTGSSGQARMQPIWTAAPSQGSLRRTWAASWRSTQRSASPSSASSSACGTTMRGRSNPATNGPSSPWLTTGRPSVSRSTGRQLRRRRCSASRAYSHQPSSASATAPYSNAIHPAADIDGAAP
jgi:hypothetical protein